MRLTMIRDKFATDLTLEERTCIPVDNLMMLTFCEKTTNFRMEYDVYQQEESLDMGSPFSHYKSMYTGDTSGE